MNSTPSDKPTDTLTATQRRPDIGRLACAALCFGLVCCLSYAGQRLWDARAAPPMGAVLLQATIPYFWRTATAAVHGLGAATLCVVVLSSRRVPADLPERLLSWAPWLVPLVVLPAVLAMLVVP